MCMSIVDVYRHEPDSTYAVRLYVEYYDGSPSL